MKSFICIFLFFFDFCFIHTHLLHSFTLLGGVLFSNWGNVRFSTRDAECLTADTLEFAAKIQLGSQSQITLL